MEPGSRQPHCDAVTVCIWSGLFHTQKILSHSSKLRTDRDKDGDGGDSANHKKKSRVYPLSRI